MSGFMSNVLKFVVGLFVVVGYMLFFGQMSNYSNPAYCMGIEVLAAVVAVLIYAGWLLSRKKQVNYAMKMATRFLIFLPVLTFMLTECNDDELDYSDMPKYETTAQRVYWEKIYWTTDRGQDLSRVQHKVDYEVNGQLKTTDIKESQYHEMHAGDRLVVLLGEPKGQLGMRLKHVDSVRVVNPRPDTKEFIERERRIQESTEDPNRRDFEVDKRKS